MPVLCATNFSDEALSATTVAGEFALKRGEELILMFVMQDYTAKAFGEQVLATAEDTLKGEAARVRKLGVKVRHTLVVGKLHVEVPRVAADEKVSLVIAGDTHKHATFFGTGTLARLGHHLEAPLWVVREADRLIAWAKGKRPLKVMIGLDHTRSSDVAVRWVEKLAAFGTLEVTGGHVFSPAVEHQRMGLPLPGTWNDSNPELLAALHREFAQKLPASLGQRIRLEAALGRASNDLGALAADDHTDLLVIGTHHRTALGQLWSVSSQCLQLATMSVACIPGTGQSAEVEGSIPRVERVLIATDFSATGDRAIGWGLGILAPGGSAELVYVAPGPLTAAEEQKIVEQLIQRLPADVRARGLTVTARALVSLSPAHAIVAAAERFSASAICLGSRGLGAISKLVLGSTAQGVFDASSRPVFVVRPPPA